MALLGGIFGIAAWVRASRLLHRVARLEETSGELLATVRRLRQPAEAPPPYAASLSPPLPLDAEAEPIPTLRKPVPQPAVTPPAATQPPTAPPLIPPQAPPERDDAIPGSQPRPHSPFLAVRWEQWIGVRGAAIVGGSVLALAALLFFRYSIERGLISPTLRVILGVTAGVACIFGSEWLRKRQQTAAANALAGAGVVALYASIWAARILYDLITTAPAFVMMVVVTAACGVLADRRQSLLIAVLGLLGGFATPLLVAARQDEPFSLFAYVLLLDAGLLWIAVRRRWPLLALLSLAGTTLHQGIWILGSMERARSGIGIAVLAVFVVAFLIAARLAGADSLTWRLSRAGAVLLPFAFALYFAARAQLSAHLAPIGALLLLLVLSASRLANVRNERALPFASAGASLGIITVWWFQHDPGWAETWEAVAVCITIAAAFLLGSELRLLGGRPQAPSSSAAFIAELGMLAILIIAAVAADDPRLWPWLSAWIVLGGLLVRHAFTHGPAAGVVVAELGGAVGLALFCLAHADDPGAEPVSLLLGVALALALVMQALAILSRATALARLTEHGAAAGALTLLLVGLALFDAGRHHPLLLVAGSTMLGLLAIQAATRVRSGAWYAASTLATALLHSLWTAFARHLASAPDVDQPMLLLQAGTCLAFAAWPLAAGRAFADRPGAWRGAALAGPAWFLSLHALFTDAIGDEAIGLLPLALGAVSLVIALASRRNLAAGPTRRSAQVWLLAVALGGVSLAIPLQVDKEWLTIGWAVNGAAILILWRRLDHAGLKYFGLALLAMVTARLIANPAVLGYHVRGDWVIVNWLLYTYLVPTIALLTASRVLRSLEVPRLLPWEKQLFGERAVASAATGLAAIAVVFVWINLAIADLFSSTEHLTLSFQRMPARDLVTSVAWAAYALVLLAIGIRSSASGLRWISLVLLIVTIAKVFLHDLGELEDLYRVGSLVGLALSLIAVSLLYQRFVLRSSPPREDQ